MKVNTLSQHAAIRSNQRGIPLYLIDLILEFGTTVNKPGGAIELILTKKTKNELIKHLKRIMHIIEKTKNKAVLVDSDMNDVITVYIKK